MIYDFLQRFISRYAEIQPLLVFFATAQVNVSANTFGQVLVGLLQFHYNAKRT